MVFNCEFLKFTMFSSLKRMYFFLQASLYLTQCSTYSTQNGWELIEVNKVLKRHEDKIQEIGKEVAREEVKPTIAAADAPPSFPTTSVISKIEEEEESANRTSGHSEGERPVVAATEGVVADRPTESSAAAAVAELSDKENGQTGEEKRKGDKKCKVDSCL